MRSWPFLAPMRRHPSVSLGKLPVWMRTPSKFGTSRISGMRLPKRLEKVTRMRYRPAGIAVMPWIFVSRSGSSRVTQKGLPLIDKSPRQESFDDGPRLTRSSISFEPAQSNYALELDVTLREAAVESDCRE